MHAAVLILLTLALFWAIFQNAGVGLEHWAVTAAVIALLTPYILRRPAAPRLPGTISWPLAILTAWSAFQLVPLPAPVLRILSPARYQLTVALINGPAPIAVAPAVSAYEWLRVAACILAFLIVRRLAWHYSDGRAPWIVAAPIVAAGFLQALLGVVQFYTGALPDAGGARGTYASYDHFAGLLEMALPFAVMYGIAALGTKARAYRAAHGRTGHAEPLPLGSALASTAAFVVAAVILLGVLLSLSRMGFVSTLAGLAVIAVCAVPSKRWLIALPAAALLLVVYLPPDQLIARFSALSAPEAISHDTRIQLARETLAMIPAYWRAGAGLGGFESAFMPYKRNDPLLTSNYVHNDYLQYLVELGAPMYLAGVILIAAVLVATGRAASRHASFSGRALATAALASMTALLVHSTADFNSYVAANSLVFAWSAALGVSGMYSSHPECDAASAVLDVRRAH